jgi:hypothetical protein
MCTHPASDASPRCYKVSNESGVRRHLIHFIVTPFEMSAWQETAQSKRDAITALLPVEWRVQELPSPIDAPDATRVIQTTLSEREIEITERLSLSQLLKRLSSGELSAAEVTAAFCHRATVAHQLVHFLNSLSCNIH